jgi:ABC-type microcin C transport system permease subunit YejE
MDSAELSQNDIPLLAQSVNALYTPLLVAVQELHERRMVPATGELDFLQQHLERRP